MNKLDWHLFLNDWGRGSLHVPESSDFDREEIFIGSGCSVSMRGQHHLTGTALFVIDKDPLVPEHLSMEAHNKVSRRYCMLRREYSLLIDSR